VSSDEIDVMLQRIRAQMELDSETEHEVMTELRSHLQEALADARGSGMDQEAAVAQVLAHFGVGEEIGQKLQTTHVGWGTADAVLAAGIPVLCGLILRWLAFAPDGTALGWPGLLNRPSFWVLALLMLIVPLIKFGRWRYAVAGWVVFWGLTVLFVTWPAVRP